MDDFIGNVYIFLPCRVADEKLFLRGKREARDFNFTSKLYLDSLEARFRYEVVRKVSNRVDRQLLTELDFACFDPDDAEADFDFKHRGMVFETIDEQAGLVVITIMLRQFRGAVTELLDRVSREELEFELPLQSSADSKLVDFESFLESKYGLSKVGTSRVFLSTFEVPEPSVAPYYFANETYLSSNMGAKVVSAVYSEQASENIAEYDLSRIYAGVNTVLRIDCDGQSREKGDRMHVPEIDSESKLVFMLEMLLLKDSAISKSNARVITEIETGRKLTLDEIEDISEQFGRTIPLWDIEVFKYITAQNLANRINSRFDLDGKMSKYLENQRFLEHKIHLRYAQQERSENAILYLIAILLFVFQGAPVLYVSILAIQAGHQLQQEQVIAFLGSMGLTLALLVLLLLVIKKKSRAASPKDCR